MKQAINLKNAFLTFYFESEGKETSILVKQAISFFKTYTSDITVGVESKRLYQFGNNVHNLFLNKVNNY